jgi:hypothetical protein
MPEDEIPEDDVLLSQLAALLADQLDEANKSRLMQVLADHPDARELLLMSYEIYRQHADLRSRHSDNRGNGEGNSKRG